MAAAPPAVVLPTDPQPVRSDVGFRVGMYEEHLEEAASLWEQRPADRLNLDLAWTDLGRDESRLDAHLDALVLGGELALAVCRARALDDDPGQMHAALRVFCRQGRGDLVATTLDALAPDDPLVLDAMAEALVLEMPEAWHAVPLAPERFVDPRWRWLAARLVEHRGGGPPPAWASALTEAPDVTVPLLARAFGRGDGVLPESALLALLGAADGQARRDAGLALVRRGSPQAVTRVLASIQTDAVLLPLLGLAGRASAVAWLRPQVARPTATPDLALALGLLGDPAAVPDLIDALDGPHPEPATHALHLLTGADLWDEQFVADVPEPDEWFDDEVARGAPDPPPDGAPRGTTLTRLTGDPDAWRRWWTANAARFTEGQRYRLGRLAGPVAEVASLAAPHVPHDWRTWAAEALAVRYRSPVRFETTWPVQRQRAALAELARWAEAQSFVDGRWYVGGRYVE